jgi:hypothetical protein
MYNQQLEIGPATGDDSFPIEGRLKGFAAAEPMLWGSKTSS